MTSKTELELRKRLATDFEFYAANALRIRTKSGQANKFRLNAAQKQIHSELEDQLTRTGKVRKIIVKGRQQGCSTYVEGRFFWKVTHHCGVRAFILTHEAEATQNLFDMAHYYYENCPEQLRPHLGASSSKELYFDKINSGYRVGTAGNKGVGRSLTAQLLHGSEVAYWPHADDHAKGLLQAIPDLDGTEVIFESTGNGQGNYFHQLWLAAVARDSEFEPIFIPWYLQPEYRKPIPKNFMLTDEEHELAQLYKLDLEQMFWRRLKVAELTDDTGDGTINFMREYPMTADEAFEMSGLQIFIEGRLVARARRNQTRIEKVGALVVGVDPARFGSDRTAIIRRQGRVAYGLETYKGIDTMQCAGYVLKIIREENPQKVMIDIGGLGAGIYDRLVELGYRDKVVAVNFGEKAYDFDRYINKRAEMWSKLKQWLVDYPCELPDSEELAIDICSPQYSYDSKSRVQIEKKEDMAKRGVKSPDCADALCLTFAEPVKEDLTHQLQDDLWNTGVSYM